jgi:hypothetical protein
MMPPHNPTARGTSRRRIPLTRALGPGLVALALTLLHPGHAGALEPWPAALKGALDAVEDDPEPEAITRDTHYWISNEYAHELFFDAVDGVGGAYVGVGTDQAWLFAGWARSEHIFIVDFDRAISDLHAVYRAFFEASPDIAAFLGHWSKEQRDASVALLTERYAALPEARRERIIRAFKRAGRLVRGRLWQVRQHFRKLRLPCYLTDEAQYAWVRGLIKADRLRTWRGNLLDKRTLRQLGAALAEHGVEVGVLYLSNAEQYFEYTPDFRENMLALPMRERSAVLHTLGWDVYGYADGHYHYTWQSGLNFQAWMREGKSAKLGWMLWYRKRHKRREKGSRQKVEVVGYSTIEKTPAEVREAIRRAKERKARKARRARRRQQAATR